MHYIPVPLQYLHLYIFAYSKQPGTPVRRNIMGLSVLLKLLTRRADGGLFYWLTSRDTNRTLRAIEHDRNLTEIEIRKDSYRIQLELEQERRKTALEILRQLGDGDEYRDSTTVGWREIRKTPAPPNTLVILSEKCGNEDHAPAERFEVIAKQAPADDLPIMPEHPQPDGPGCIGPP